MELYLANNDPTRTVLINDIGPLYVIDTPLPHLKAGNTTTIRRFETHSGSSGHVQTEIGKVDYQETRLSLTDQVGKELVIQPGIGLELQTPWSFTGPDGRPYKWQVFIHYPVLMLDDNSHTPLARYRRAKLGIISRSRRAFLEIFPAGLLAIDMVVVTFVSYMKQSMRVESPSTALGGAHSEGRGG